MNTVPEKLYNPRQEIRQLLLDGELEKLLEMTGMLHGHYCPGVSLGVKAVYIAFKELGITDNTGMEEIMAVVECNNCFVDGVQFASGCSLGNNALVYKDLGKAAATFYKRGSSDAVRVCAKSFDLDTEPDDEKQEADALFERAVKKREKLSDTEQKRMKELWIKRSFAVVNAPDTDIFTITRTNAPVFAFAPIFDSQTCSVCGDKVMETRTHLQNGKPVCIPCAKAEYQMVVGQGIVTGGGISS